MLILLLLAVRRSWNNQIKSDGVFTLDVSGSQISLESSASLKSRQLMLNSALCICVHWDRGVMLMRSRQDKEISSAPPSKAQNLHLSQPARLIKAHTNRAD